MTRAAERLSAAAVACALAASIPGAAVSPGAFESMADAERAFARMAAAKGIRAAFLDYLDDDAIGFHPPFGRAKDEWTSRPSPADPLANQLEWEPRIGGVSGDGRLGWLSGPYTFVPERDRSKAAYGCYFSVWRRTAEGPWRVFMDIGISTPAACEMPSVLEEVPPAAPPVSSTLDALIDAERQAVSLGSGGLERTLARVSDPALRVHLEGRQPLVGREAALRALKPDTAGLTFTTRDAFASPAGDLGVSYGLVRRAGDDQPSAYVRVWRPDEQARWRVVFQTVAR